MQLLGNEHIRDVMRRMIERDRVPRSLLLAGPDGVGKRRFALGLARTFVCTDRRGFEACGECRTCRRAESFTFPAPDAKRDEFERVFFSEHPDVGMVIPFKNNILVGSIRALETESNYRPYEAGVRFFVIDEAHRMNDAASNALLKTLEEPATTSHILLVTSRPDSLLQTIRSRCQTLRFAPVSAEVIESHLLESGKFSPDDARLLASLAAGSIGRALSIDLEKLRPRRESMLRALESLGRGSDFLTLLKTAEEIADPKNKDDYETYLEILQTLIRDVWAIRLGSDAAVVNADLNARLRTIADSADSRRLAAWLEGIESLREQLAVNLNRKIASDALFMRMAR
jgi:DNA polymerase-3 subunit delta'